MTKAEKAYRGSVAQIGCIICGNPFVELHHVRRLATSKKRKKAPLLPLCEKHHRTGGRGVAVHDGRESWEAAHGSELEWVERIERGILK